MILTENPRFNLLKGDESDTSLVLDIGPDGKDRSTSALDMTPQADWILGSKYGTGDGTGDYLYDSNAFRPSDSAGTIAVWFKMGAVGATQVLFGSCDEGTAGSYRVYVGAHSTNVIQFFTSIVATTNDIRGSTTLVAGQWYRLVMTSSGTGYAMYLNGVAETPTVSSGADDGTWFGDVANRDNITIGAQRFNAVASYLNGNVASCQVYSRAWTADECYADYLSAVPEPDLVAAWDGSGKDNSVYGNDMTPQADAIVGGQISLDGTGDHLYRSEATWRSGDDVGTVLAWAKLAAGSASTQTILSIGDEGTAADYLVFGVSSDEVGLVVGQFGGGAANGAKGATVWAPGQWYHFAVTSNGSAWTVYVNGQEDSTAVSTGSNNGNWFNSVANSDNIIIGGLKYTSFITPFNGNIDTVKVYKAALSADEIKARYLAERGLAR